MSKIQEAAVYRGVVVEHAVGATKEKGLPQFVAKLQALERYDVTDKTWVDWSAREDCEITAFLVLISKKGEPIFHAKAVQKVFEWDGASLVGLNTLDLENAEVQFEVVEHEFEGKESLQVANIRGYNEEPGTSVKKLDDDELAKLNAQHSNALKKLSGGPKTATKAGKTTTAKAATAKKGKKTSPPPPPAALSEEEAVAEATKEVLEVPVEEAIEEFNHSGEKNKVPPPPTAPPAPPSTTKKTAPAKTMTYEEAWKESYNKKAKTVDDNTITAAFTAAMHRQCPNKSEKEISGEDWALIAEAVIGECG